MLHELDQLFENLPKILRPDRVASILGLSKKTIYDWHYRQKQRRVPAELFVKFNRSLYLRTDILKQWIASQNPSLA
jgi:predicted DNA-binding transcriptional regulator AlpA